MAQDAEECDTTELAKLQACCLCLRWLRYCLRSCDVLVALGQALERCFKGKRLNMACMFAAACRKA